MAVHSLEGGASVDVLSVTGRFGTQAPRVERDELGTRILVFDRPTGTGTTADIAFRFKPRRVPDGTTFGIKQFVSVDWYNFSHKGNKAVDGWIWQSFKPQERFTLDVSPRSLTVLFHPTTNLPTGAQATAAHAPFYSALPTFARNDMDAELSIADAPGGSFSLEMRNVATDRVNYLHAVHIKQTFLTVLVVVGRDGNHLPLEAAYWQNEVKGEVIWDEKGQHNVSGIAHANRGLGTFHGLDRNFAICDFDLLSNRSLSARDCMVQKMNDAMYAVRGLYRGQDFTKATRTQTRLEAKGYELIQYPSGL